MSYLHLILNDLFLKLQVVSPSNLNLIKLEQTLFKLAADPKLTHGVAYCLALPQEDGYWCIRYKSIANPYQDQGLPL